jgi:hypothetical protein
MNEVWENRCANDPQGVIKDLVAQTTRQAKAINELTLEKERLTGLLVAAGIDITKQPEPKKTKKKKTDGLSSE